ncbi:TIGR04063 family PEP-CTERM/XrtA system glycosyltransferase [Massilia endophytica]|uniref:TIGR04063 family PEP-CTERM/XrtA system glycosyltransferase n=1 Tax=Massilia endophytica TaxID=2899220 RepID=UPI001E4E1361|nr:TIGR04063 family PEP-CTERM/XrtA system glycosyltransferase [Massilia endophytica]UGQ46210.1 glycosyltransferase, exosortase A system-associated [Massilia endophytica]
MQTDKPLRILHILDHSIPLQSGYAMRTRSIIRTQRELGWETFHLTSAKQGASGYPEALVDGLAFYRCEPLRGTLARLPVLRQMLVVYQLLQRMREVAAEVQPDILHAHSPVLNAIAALFVSRQLGIPLVYEVRAFWEDAAVDHGTSHPWGPRYWLTRKLETWALRKADGAATICEGLRRDLIARGLPAGRIRVIPNAVDTASFMLHYRRDSVFAQYLGLEGKIVLGFAGSFYGYEGLGLLLEAMPAMVASYADLRLLLVGSGPQEAALRRRAAALGLERHVIFTGQVPHSEVQRYYSLIDVLCYPRLRMRLTELVTPLKPLEAMAQGRLIVASNVGGHRELIQDGRTGVLFEAGDAQDLARKVIGLLESPWQWPMLRERARHYVEQERTWMSSVRGYRELYEQVLNNKESAT